MTDRLALVCKIVLDQQVLNLRREVEELKLQLFWKDHDVRALAAKMRQANQNGPRCACDACACMRYHLFPGHMFPTPYMLEDCAFAPWFESLLSQFGLTSDHHIIHKNTKFPGAWVEFEYGPALLDAKSIHDPELKRLRRLFNAL